MRLYKKWSKLFVCLFVIFIAVFIFYIEVLAYYLNTKNWFQLKCENEKNCVRILLVADPQIIGNFGDRNHYLLTPFSIFDSDRYLRKTYSYAYDFVKPDVVVFLGDLMDEGHSATTAEFYGYVRRVFRIFLDYSKNNVKHIWLPGDNDIGGEDFNASPSKIKRFHRAFAQSDLFNIKNTTFFKIDRLTQSIPVFKKPREFYDTSKIFVGLSHIPLMFIPSLFVDKVIKKMLPQVLFTGHEHKSMIISTDGLLRQDYHIVPVTPETNAVFEYTLGVTDMYEIIIPTCSYRMGTNKIGYGYSVIEKNTLRFTVLWSPSRFDQLHSYFVLSIFCVLLSLVCVLFSIWNHAISCRKNYVTLQIIR